MKKQKTYNQIIEENAILRENNAWLLLATKANGCIVRMLEKEIYRLKNMKTRRG
jgi:hypothetical protein